MEKKLPKVFANKIPKELANNDRVYYSKGEEKKVTKKNDKPKDFLTITQKINKVFSSSKYIYKADVNITYNDGRTETRRIIGHNKNELITFDNQTIKIADIADIENSD